MNKEIHLFTTIDRDWLDYALMFIASVRKASAAPIRYTILCPGPADTGRMAAWCAANGVSLDVVDFDRKITQAGLAEVLDLATPGGNLSACVYWGRYCAQYVLDDLPARLIYADVDMYAVDDMGPLMEVDLGAAAVGAVRYPNDDDVRRTGVPRGQYVNNGLLVFDTARFDGRECIRGMHQALATGLPVFGPQCAFNMAMQGKIALLDEAWNVQGEWRGRDAGTERLIHFTGKTKPWHTLSIDPMRWEVRRLLREVGCTRAWRPDRTAGRMLRLAARRTRALWRHA